MEPKFQTSFIPKKPVVSTSGSMPPPDVIREVNPISVVANVIFVVMLFVSGALFGYKIILNNQIAEYGANLESARETFQLDKIQEMIDANARLTASRNLLEEHIIVSEVLSLMEELTVQRVRLQELSYRKQGAISELNLKGEVATYNALATQGKIFSENEFISDFRFYDFNPTENGNVTFSFSSKVKRDLVSYPRVLGETQ